MTSSSARRPTAPGAYRRPIAGLSGATSVVTAPQRGILSCPGVRRSAAGVSVRRATSGVGPAGAR